jgi:hypothetical protein
LESQRPGTRPLNVSNDRQHVSSVRRLRTGLSLQFLEMQGDLHKMQGGAGTKPGQKLPNLNRLDAVSLFPEQGDYNFLAGRMANRARTCICGSALRLGQFAKATQGQVRGWAVRLSLALIPFNLI